jgi:hypothetical protein
MKVNRTTRKWLVISGLWVLALAGIATSFAQERGHPGPEGGRGGPRGQFFDNRFGHGHYYPAQGAVVRTLPGGYRPYVYGGRSFYFNAGVWYAPGPYGYVVTRPPFGLYVSVLPPFYTTVWFGGAPYYYADDVYYQWRPDMNGYVVAPPPPGAEQPNAAPDAPPPQPAGDFFVYPRNGQTPEQQSADRYECHTWAKTQTGFDPTQPAGGSAGGPPGAGAGREQYQRAITACLEARGYSVK